MNYGYLALIPMIAIAVSAPTETHRSHDLPREFMLHHPCPGGPDMGHTHGRCRGYVRDHIIPLCKNGPDTIENLQWQTVEDAKAKDKWECKR